MLALAAPGMAVLTAHLGGGYDGPPPLTVGRLFTAWQADPYLIAGLVVIAAGYLAAVARLRRRGDHWPVGRTVAFVGLGLGTIAVATMSSLGVYDDILFSAHMGQHMVLTMISPVFLALGAPITLALRALSGRRRGLLLGVLHSRLARVLSSPVLGWPLFVGTPFVLYFTSLYPYQLQHDWFHELVHVHFVLVGALFFWPILGLDPLPGRLLYPIRVLVAFTTLPFHAFLGIAIMSSNTLLAGDYYRSLHRSWGPSLLADQHLGGGILWASGDLVGLLFMGALVVQWMRADERSALREDRRLDRLERVTAAGPLEPVESPAERRVDLAARHEAELSARQQEELAAQHEARLEEELAAYNAALAELAQRSPPRRSAP